VQALNKIGMQYAFLVVMDGACKAVLKRINEELPKVFGHRCSTHGCSLLMADIGKLFRIQCQIIARLLHFVCMHDGIYDILLNLEGALQLLNVVATRFGSVVYAVERIIKDKNSLITLWNHPRMIEYLERPGTSAVIQQEYHDLNDLLISNISEWKKMKYFYEIQEPARVLLRHTDSHTPSLPDVAFLYDSNRQLSIDAAKNCAHEFPGLNDGQLVHNVTGYWNRRKKDIVTIQALAAAMVNPHNVYNDTGLYTPPDGRYLLLLEHIISA
jgi:hypothetical protein